MDFYRWPLLHQVLILRSCLTTICVFASLLNDKRSSRSPSVFKLVSSSADPGYVEISGFLCDLVKVGYVIASNNLWPEYGSCLQTNMYIVRTCAQFYNSLLHKLNKISCSCFNWKLKKTLYNWVRACSWT